MLHHLAHRGIHRETKLCTNPPGCALNCTHHGLRPRGKDPTIAIGGRWVIRLESDSDPSDLEAEALLCYFSESSSLSWTRSRANHQKSQNSCRVPSSRSFVHLRSRHFSLHTPRIVLLPLNRCAAISLGVFRFACDISCGQAICVWDCAGESIISTSRLALLFHPSGVIGKPYKAIHYCSHTAMLSRTCASSVPGFLEITQSSSFPLDHLWIGSHGRFIFRATRHLARPPSRGIDMGESGRGQGCQLTGRQLR